MKKKQHYAYLVTEATGSMIGKVNIGEFLIETEYKGNGSYTWFVFNFETAEETGSMTGHYSGKVEVIEGMLTEASKEKLKGA